MFIFLLPFFSICHFPTSPSFRCRSFRLSVFPCLFFLISVFLCPFPYNRVSTHNYKYAAQSCWVAKKFSDLNLWLLLCYAVSSSSINEVVGIHVRPVSMKFCMLLFILGSSVFISSTMSQSAKVLLLTKRKLKPRLAVRHWESYLVQKLWWV